MGPDGIFISNNQGEAQSTAVSEYDRNEKFSEQSLSVNACSGFSGKIPANSPLEFNLSIQGCANASSGVRSIKGSDKPIDQRFLVGLLHHF